jgi:HD-GYP domain-containing protein (c-di-GMP phosphodiesterase class II)
MNLKTRVYVFLTCVLSAGLGYALYRYAPAVDSDTLVAVLLLAGLAVIAEMLAFLLPGAARGSIAFIPYLAAVLVAPSWVTVVAVAAVKAMMEIVLRIEPLKAIFNVAQHALVVSFAVVTYLALGGTSMPTLPDHRLAQLTVEAGFPAFAAISVSFIANTLLLSPAIALESRRSVGSVLRELYAPTIGIDLLAGPIIFMFAWVYTRFGPIAALAAWVPILGFRQLNKTKLDLEQTNRELLELMVTTLEARDPYTSGHSRRVQHFAVLIARAMRLPEREVRRVSQAALLHDVGKIYEKYAPILSKADKLTPEEWVIMQQHPADGERLVSTMTRLKDLVPAIRHHHEQWDGTGYPDGIAGDQIPLAARIIALADTIDAMTSHRPYRSALSEDQVRAELVRCRGRQFDPSLTDEILSAANWRKLFAPARGYTPRSSPALTIVSPSRRAAV